ncbi:O-antigen ligase family protein [Deltaproteobacteria bacterium PRO3]|nr:O-antigen ligase family protein [Deltaproteobacteria bacterium PRO3]
MESTLNRKTYHAIFCFYQISLVFLPLSFATKLILGIPSITWIEPTLIINFLIFPFQIPTLKFSDALALICATLLFPTIVIVFSLISLISLDPAPFSKTLVEIARLSLCSIFAFNSYNFLSQTNFRKRAYFTIGVSGTLQLLFAIYIISTPFLPVPTLSSLKEYAIEYLYRQSVFGFGIPIPRLGGTFIESPPFGLFMLCVLMVSIFNFREFKTKSSVFFILASSFGTLASLSSQVLLSAILIGGIFYFRSRFAKKNILFFNITFLIAVVFLVTCYLALPYFSQKYTEFITGQFSGTSFGERYFHLEKSLDLLSQNIRILIIGIGAGNFGFYSAKDGIFPDTVTPQFIVSEILVENGILGLTIFLFTILFIIKKINKGMGYYGVLLFLALFFANSFQSNWKQPSFFLLLSLLLAIASKERVYNLPSNAEMITIKTH